jgi:hypothetical protein
MGASDTHISLLLCVVHCSQLRTELAFGEKGILKRQDCIQVDEKLLLLTENSPHNSRRQSLGQSFREKDSSWKALSYYVSSIFLTSVKRIDLCGGFWGSGHQFRLRVSKNSDIKPRNGIQKSTDNDQTCRGQLNIRRD